MEAHDAEAHTRLDNHDADLDRLDRRQSNLNDRVYRLDQKLDAEVCHLEDKVRDLENKLSDLGRR